MKSRESEEYDRINTCNKVKSIIKESRRGED